MPLDPEAVRSAIASRLPLTTRWMVNETPMDYDFSKAQRVLQPLDRMRCSTRQKPSGLTC